MFIQQSSLVLQIAGLEGLMNGDVYKIQRQLIKSSHCLL